MAPSDQSTAGNRSTALPNLPIFPLNLVLFPGSALPLKIFEQRYQEMTKACLRDDTPFAVCLIRDGHEVGAPAEHERIGCSARISDWEMPHPGIFLLNCVGQNAVRLLDSRVAGNGLIHSDVECLVDDNGDVGAQDFELCRSMLERFVERAGARFGAAPPAFDDPAWVSYRLAEILPVDVHVKQDLLEQRSTALRVSAIAELLQSG